MGLLFPLWCLHLGTIDFWCWVILGCGGLSCASEDVRPHASQVPTPLDASSKIPSQLRPLEISLGVSQYSLVEWGGGEEKLPLVKNRCFINSLG